ncbi:MAG: SH3 domain-containing protein [Dehalococcoidia bacterium]|nr:SH3 domain-containing protein [Dehalococcoidia bacterium]
MTVTSQSPMRTTREPEWTPRQREVLDLLVRGRTNSQIGDQLGISLDGAKWHVSEIITRLGVESRDEAAEYWRHHNGLRLRFSRLSGGFFGWSALKWGAGAALVGAIGIAAAVVLLVLREGSGGDPDQGAGPLATETPTPDASPSATATPPPGLTPLPSGETVAGVPVGAMSFGKPGSLPVPLSVIVERGCYQCDGPAESFDRVTLDVNGQLKVETLFKPSSGYISASYWDPAGREHYLSICSRGYCGGVGPISTDAQTTIHRSKDGGVTWQPLTTLDGFVSVAGYTAQGPVLNLSSYTAPGVTDWKFQVLGQSQVIRPPAGAEPVFSDNRLIGWRKTGSRDVLNIDGTPLVTLPDVPTVNGRPVQIEGLLGNGTILISWLAGPDSRTYSTYLGLMKNGALVSVLKGDSSLNIGTVLTQAAAFGNVSASPADIDPTSSDKNEKYLPAFVEMDTGQITLLELYGPVFSSAYDFQRNIIRLVEPGPFVRVKGAGDCLNVRQSPSTTGALLGCFADNVLLKNLGETQQSGGITWWKVQTPDGTPGWASAEFLEGSRPRQ